MGKSVKGGFFSQIPLSFLSLFTSIGTLVCCALPALLVTIAAGAVLAGAISAFPQLVWLSRHKDIIFIVAAILLTLTGLLRWMTRNAPCPVDPRKARQCTSMRRWSLWLYIGSLVIFSIGYFFAYWAADLLL